MSSSSAMVPEVKEIHATDTVFSMPSCSSASSNKLKPLNFLVDFTLHDVTRLILTYDDDDDEEEEEETVDIRHDDVAPMVTPVVALDPDDKFSWDMLRCYLYDMNFHTKSSQDPVLRVLATYVNDIIKAHYCPSDRAHIVPKNIGRAVRLSVVIDRVLVHRDRVSGVGATVPADVEAIKRLRRVKGGEYLEGREEDEQCRICLDVLANKGEEDDQVTCLPCDHAFHEGCIVEWLNTSHYCPLCRFELPVRMEED